MPSGPCTWSCTTGRGCPDHAAPFRCAGGRTREHDSSFDKHRQFARPVPAPAALCSCSSSSAPSGYRGARLPQTPPRLAPACTGTCAIPMPAAQTQAWDDLCSRRATCPCVLRCCHQRSCVRRYQHSSKDSGEMMTLLLTALCWYETEAESGGGDSEYLSS